MKFGALASIVIAAAFPAAAQSITDGDTLKKGGVTYRLWGIDAPEAKQTACSRLRNIFAAFTS